jgi:MFS family permease
MNNTKNNMILFWASFLTLIAAGMGFAIRNDIINKWGEEFGFTQTELGQITGMGLFGFGVTIILFSFIADRVGYGRLMIVAFLLHLTGAVTTLAAPFAYEAGGKAGAYWCLYLGALAFSLANGTCEAVINPLTATIFPNNKTHWLNILHAGWPGGLVLGALAGLALNRFEAGWQIKWGIVLAPIAIYGVLMVGRRFPRSEAHEAGIPAAQMIGVLLSGILLFLFLLHALVGYVELGVDTWIIDITKVVLANPDTALLVFIWTNVLMFTLRFFAGPIVHKISPLGLLLASAVLGTIGLILLGVPAINTTPLWLVAVTVYGLGKTFYWPTLLGVISERFPKGGAIALGISGGIGMISAGLLGAPLIGYKQDYASTTYLKEDEMPTYQRYKAKDEDKPVPFVTPIVALDNGKVGVLFNYMDLKSKLDDVTKTPDITKLRLVKVLEVIRKQEEDKKQKLKPGEELPENKQLEELEERMAWWKAQGQPNADHDFKIVKAAQAYGGKQALTWTAAVPAALTVGFLLLVIYFRAKGGYKAEVLVGHKAEDEKFTGGTQGPGEG